MAYEYGALEIPLVNPTQMHEDARARCQGWGYTEAQTFAGQTHECIRWGYSDCLRWRVSVLYQCLDTP